MRQSFHFPSADGQTSIHVIEWIPAGEVRAVLQISHGMVEHILRYDRFASAMSEAGIYVVGNDHLGHGESIREGGQKGYFKHPDGNECLLSDIHTLRHITEEKYPGVPYFLLGHSMGSFLARQYVSLHGEGLAGAIIMGTGLQPGAVLVAAKAICRIIAAFRGWEHRSSFVDKLAFSSNNKNFKNPRTPSDWLTKNEAVVDQYRSDPMCGYVFTLNGFYQMFRSIGMAQENRAYTEVPENCPLFLVSGEDDPIGKCGKDIKALYESYRAAGKNVRMNLYPGDRHEILNELDYETVYDDLRQFILSPNE